MYKLNKIRGFVALPIIIGSAVLVVGVLGGLAYEYKNNQSILSVQNKDSMPTQLSNLFGVDKNKMLAQVSSVAQFDKYAQIIALQDEIISIRAQIDIKRQNGDIVGANELTSQLLNLQSNLKTFASMDTVINNTNGAIIFSISFYNAINSGDLNSGARIDYKFNDFDQGKYTAKIFTTCSPGVSIIMPAVSGTGNNMCNFTITLPTVSGQFVGSYGGNTQNSNSEVGTVNFSVKVIDNTTQNIKDEMTAQTRVFPAPIVKVLSPKSGEALSEGQPYTIKWESTNVPIYADGSLSLVSSDDKIALIAPNILSSQNSYTWNVTTNLDWRRTDLGYIDQFKSFYANLYNLFLGKPILAATPVNYKIRVWWNDYLKNVSYQDDGDYFTISGTPSTLTTSMPTYTKTTKADLLLMLNDAIGVDGVITDSEKTNLLTALNSYLQ